MKYRRQQGIDGNPAPRGSRRRRTIAVLPTLFTLGNCLCGFASLHYAALPYKPANMATGDFASTYAIAGYLIFTAMVFDMLDGRMARLAKATSDFGGELDSLADMVSFGTAPAFLALRLIGDLLRNQYAHTNSLDPAPFVFLGPNAENTLGKLFWIIGAIYVACAALRLARFNVHNRHGEEAHMVFHGLPSPGAAGVVASSVIFFETLHSIKHLFPFHVPADVSYGVKIAFPYAMPAILLVTGLLMVSRFPYSHVINQYLRGRRPFSYVARLAVFLLLFLWQPQVMALLAIYFYAFFTPLHEGWRKLTQRGQPALKDSEKAARVQQEEPPAA